MTKNYWKPTPIFWRKIGDTLLAVGSFAGTFSISQDHQWIGVAIFCASIAGKFLTNFFKEDEKPI